MNFGVVGNNLYGQIFIRALKAMDEVATIAICPEFNENLEPIIAEYQLKPYPGFQEMLDAEKLDAVILASVTAKHPDQAILALQAGAHVLVDRPIAKDLESCDRMIAFALSANRILMTGHVLQFWPEYVAIREVLGRGDLGPILNISGYRVSGTLNPEWHMRLTNPNYGLAGLEAHIHDVDILNTFVGKPESVFAQGTRNQNGAWIQVQSNISYVNHLPAALEANYSVPRNFPLSMYLKLVGEGATLVYTFQGALAAQKTAQRSLYLFRNGVEPQEITVTIQDSYLEMVKHFIACIKYNQQPEWGNANQARQALEVVLAIARSAEEQRVVFLRDGESM
jgi:predicted dehydrogenase